LDLRKPFQKFVRKLLPTKQEKIEEFCEEEKNLNRENFREK